ncbi:MAG: TlpA disulfide reductase family protein [Candidatus Solibacter sp.]
MPNPRVSRFSILTLFALMVPAILGGNDTRAVDLPFKDLKGQKVRLRDYRGKVVVLNFWATWCLPCRAEMPMLAEVEREYAKRGVVFLAASIDERQDRPQIPDFVTRFNIAFPVVVGASVLDLEDLKLGQAIPATAFLDKQGRVVARVLGQMSREQLAERLDWLTGEAKGPAPNPLLRNLGEK